MNFTDITPSDLIEFDYEGNRRIVFVRETSIVDEKKYVSGNEVTDNCSFKKFTWDKISDGNWITSNTTLESVTLIDKDECLNYYISKDYVVTYTVEQPKVPVGRSLFVQDGKLFVGEGTLVVDKLSEEQIRILTNG